MILTTQRRYIGLVGFIALVSWIGWMLVLRRLDPCLTPGEIIVCDQVSSLAMILFFVSLFFALTATFTILGYFIRLWLHRHEVFTDTVNVTLRQGMLLAIVSIVSLGMLALGVLRWWSGLLLITIVLLLELYFTRST